MTATQLKELIKQCSRETYDGYIDSRDKMLCEIVEHFGQKKCIELTGWSKPTIITALYRHRPDLLKRNQTT